MKVKVDSYLQPLMPKFLAYLEAELSTLLMATDQLDFEVLKSKGHSLKGTCGGYGFDELSDIARSLEESAVQKDLPTSKEIVAKFKAAVSGMEIEYFDEEGT